MPILQSCYCCCSSAKQLAIAGGIYSLVLSSVYIGNFTSGIQFFPEDGGNNSSPMINASVQSVNDSDSPSPKKIFGDDSTKVVGSVINPNGFPKEDQFYVSRIKVCCDIFVLGSIPLLLVGIFQKRKYYLVPWIVANVIHSSTNLIETIYLLGLNTTEFEPTTAFIFTATFFLLFAHVYAILGVISLFQEFSDSDQNIPNFELGPVISSASNVNNHGGTTSIIPNGVPKVTITYADRVDLEESITSPNGPENIPSTKIDTNVVIKKKNGFKNKFSGAFSPMEPIEECSMEISSTSAEKKDQVEQDERSSSSRLGTSSKTSATADPNTIGNDNSITIETNGNEDSSIKTLQQFSNTALATAKKYLLQSRFTNPPSLERQPTML